VYDGDRQRASVTTRKTQRIVLALTAMNPLPRPAISLRRLSEHGRQRSYVACRHVTDEHAESAHVALATDTEMGKIFATCRNTMF
jgi:hypothetical protein